MQRNCRIRIAQTGFANQDTLVPILVGAVFTIIGACLYWFGTVPRVFDQRLAAFWRDGSRINVVGHGNLERLRSDANRLSQFLDKPVWDAT